MAITRGDHRPLNNLATLYQAQGKYAEAEPLHKRALAIWEKALGPDHPQVATTLENMAKLYKKTGRNEEAKRLEERAQEIRSRTR
ncbi:MAG: tetratricopeptide repeat protein [Candidatus Binatia bacterium]